MYEEVPFNGINNVVFLKLLLCDQLKCTKEELDFKVVTHFSLEHKQLVKINCLWPLSNLKKLNLSSNAIKRIENLDTLTQLEDLDLSFNEISRIENLHTLTSLRRLTLYANRIEVLENMESLKGLRMLNVGANRIHDQACPFYLAQFKHLSCLVLAENPCYAQPENEIDDYLLPLMPQLVDLNNRRVTDKDRYLATARYKIKTKGLKKFGMGRLDALTSKKRNNKSRQKTTAVATIGERLYADMLVGHKHVVELAGEGDVFKMLNQQFAKQMSDLLERAHACGDRIRKKLQNHRRTLDELEAESTETQKLFIRDVGDCLHGDEGADKQRRTLRTLRKNLLAEECDMQQRFETLFDDLEKKLAAESAQQIKNLNVICSQLKSAVERYVDTVFKLVANYYRAPARMAADGENSRMNNAEHRFWNEVDLREYENVFRQHCVAFIDDLETRITNELEDWDKQLADAFRKNLVRHRKAVARIVNAVKAMNVQ